MTIGGAMTLMFVLHAEACLAFLAMDRPGMASAAMAIGLAWVMVSPRRHG